MAAQAYDEQLLGALRRHVLEPLARSCEADLRLHLVHFLGPIAAPLNRSSLPQTRMVPAAGFCWRKSRSEGRHCCCLSHAQGALH